jgi:hypothetical protein
MDAATLYVKGRARVEECCFSARKVRHQDGLSPRQSVTKPPQRLFISFEALAQK